MPLNAAPQFDPTGTALQDIPRSIQVVPRDLVELQGGVKLTDTLRNVSGVTQGGQFAFGFFDRVIIRGLNVTYLNDGLPEGTSDLTGVTHTLTGVERLEVLKGPGSALYGSAEQGGTINLVHYRPSDVFTIGASEQYGAFNTTTTDAYAGGPTGVSGVNFRLDGEYHSSDGFRGQADKASEVLGALNFKPEHHDIEFRAEYRKLQNTPDASGIPFSPPAGTGTPAPVAATSVYYTPYAFANQEIKRLFLSDAWTASDLLTVNLRGAASKRDVDLARNAGGSVKLTSGLYALTGRQLRQQSDRVDDLNLQAEPTWRFDTGSLHHVLVTGGDARSLSGTTARNTADLPNIANVLAPVVADGTLAGLSFKCDASHSCDNAALQAHFYGLYAVDQIAVTQAFRLRLSVRQNWFETQGDARALLPVNGGQEQPCSPPAATLCPWVPGQAVKRSDSIATWDVGGVYFLTPALSAFAGYASTAYPIFNTEEPESIGQTPETGVQYEAGLRMRAGAWLSLSSSVYRVTRDNVFTFLVIPSPAGVGNIDVPQVFSYRVQGWESDANVRPLRDWSLIANLALQTPVITSYPQTPADVGHRPPSIPKVIANAFTTYDLHFASPISTLQLALGARYRDQEYTDAGQTRILPGATMVDASIAWPASNWTATVGVQNIFDRPNFLYGDGTGGGALPGPGRTAYVKLSLRS